MGIKRLYSYLRYAFEEANLSKLSGKTVGIDAMGWLYQAYFCQCDLEAEVQLGIVRNMERKISLLENNHIKFIFVIDGLNLPCKNNTLKKRESKREKFKQKSLKMEKEKYDIGESAVYKKYSETISKEIVHFFIDFLKNRGSDFIVAPYEADSQLNYMYKEKQIDYIMSEDSDIAGFGCKDIVKGLRKNGKCTIINKKILEKFSNSLKNKRNDPNYTKMFKADQFFKLEIEDKIRLSVYSGCDYLENIKGIGFGTLITYFTEPNEKNQLAKKIKRIIDRIIDKEVLPQGVQSSVQYFELVSLVEKSFNHQLVYNKKSKRFTRLSKLNKKTEKNVIDYIGSCKEFGDIDHEQFANGELDLETLEKRKESDYPFDKDIKFIKKKPLMGLLNNLCTQNYGYANFEDFDESDKISEDENDNVYSGRRGSRESNTRHGKKKTKME